jgi:hypothetical protein
MKRILVIALLAILLSACGLSPDEVQSTLAAYTPVVQTKIVQVIITQPARVVEKISVEYRVVTATPSGPTATPFPQNKVEKAPGTYLVGSEISPGNWRSLGLGSNCYWKVMDATGDTIDNYLGMAGTIAFIPANAYAVELDPACGNWKFLQ